MNYNVAFREQIQSMLDMGVLLTELKRDFKDFQAFKLGLIDGNGNRIRPPKTLDEQAAYSPMLKTIFRLKRYLGAKVDLLEATTLLEKEALDASDLDYYKKCLVHKDKVQGVVNELYKVLDEAYSDGLALEDVAKLVRA